MANIVIKLSNEYIRGLIEGEGCFSFHTRNAKTPFLRNGQKIKEKMTAFCLSMHERDENLIKAVRDHLGLKNKVYIYGPYKGDGYKSKSVRC